MAMMMKGDVERQAGGKTLPKADGPYVIDRKPMEHTAVLSEPQSSSPILDGRRLRGPSASSFRWNFLSRPAVSVPARVTWWDPLGTYRGRRYYCSGQMMS